MSAKVIMAADLFCGAGGTSEGLARACSNLGFGLDLLAVNHWQVAVATHSGNHPDARHLCVDLEAVNPREVVPGGRLQLIVASPECTHHSTARGGRPVSDQKRASAWHILRWLEALYVDAVLIENVPEFRSWGPIGANGRPLKSKRGETYRAFIMALESLGYRVQAKVLNAADYGDPTTRRRLFIMARRGRDATIRWPEPTHAPRPHLFAKERWVPAREVIDWTIPGQSIFRRRRPLAPATMRRILAGLERFGGAELEPFLVILRGTGTARSVDAPMPALTANGTHLGLAQPFIVPQQSKGVPRSVEDPLVTVATKGAISLVQPYLVHYNGDADRTPRLGSLDDPLGTITAGAKRFGICCPYLVPFYGEREGQAPRTHSVEAPIPTTPATAVKLGLCEPFLHHVTHSGRSRSVDEPLPTVTGAHRGELGVVQPFLTKFNGTGGAHSVEEPIPTISTRDRYGLVQPIIDGVALDVTFRMLQPHELAAAMSFPRSYRFTGTRTDQVKQIGNAVPVRLAAALCEALLTPAGARTNTARRRHVGDNQYEK